MNRPIDKTQLPAHVKPETISDGFYGLYATMGKNKN